MNPSPFAISWIQGQVAAMSGAWTNANAQIVTALNTALAPNPTPQGTVPKPYTIATLEAELSSASQKNLALYPSLAAVLSSVNASDTPSVILWANTLVNAGVILSAECTAIVAAVTATEPDPNWQAQLPISVINLGRLVDTNDVQAARI